MQKIKRNFTQENHYGLPESLYTQNDKDMQIALHEANGNIYEAAQMVGATVKVYQMHMGSTHAVGISLLDSYDIAKEEISAIALTNVIHSIRGGSTTDSKWWLERYGTDVAIS